MTLNLGVKITLDKERTLKLSLGAMLAFDQATGKNIFKLDWRNLTASDIQALLWACLKHEDKNLTQEMVGEMVHPGNMIEVISKLTEVWTISMPEGESADPLAGKPPVG